MNNRLKRGRTRLEPAKRRLNLTPGAPPARRRIGADTIFQRTCHRIKVVCQQADLIALTDHNALAQITGRDPPCYLGEATERHRYILPGLFYNKEATENDSFRFRC